MKNKYIFEILFALIIVEMIFLINTTQEMKYNIYMGDCKEDNSFELHKNNTLYFTNHFNITDCELLYLKDGKREK